MKILIVEDNEPLGAFLLQRPVKPLPLQSDEMRGRFRRAFVDGALDAAFDGGERHFAGIGQVLIRIADGDEAEHLAPRFIVGDAPLFGGLQGLGTLGSGVLGHSGTHRKLGSSLALVKGDIADLTSARPHAPPL